MKVTKETYLVVDSVLDGSMVETTDWDKCFSVILHEAGDAERMVVFGKNFFASEAKKGQMIKMTLCQYPPR